MVHGAYKGSPNRNVTLWKKLLTCSVTRLGYFWKVSVTNFLTNAVQIFCNILVCFVNIGTSFTVKSILASFGNYKKIWTNIWSHWFTPRISFQRLLVAIVTKFYLKEVPIKIVWWVKSLKSFWSNGLMLLSSWKICRICSACRGQRFGRICHQFTLLSSRL